MTMKKPLKIKDFFGGEGALHVMCTTLISIFDYPERDISFVMYPPKWTIFKNVKCKRKKHDIIKLLYR